MRWDASVRMSIVIELYSPGDPWGVGFCRIWIMTSGSIGLSSDFFQSKSDSDCVGIWRNSDRITSDFIGFPRIPMKYESDSDREESATIISNSIGFLQKLSDFDEIGRGSDRFRSNLPVELNHLGSISPQLIPHHTNKMQPLSSSVYAKLQCEFPCYSLNSDLFLCGRMVPNGHI